MNINFVAFSTVGLYSIVVAVVIYWCVYRLYKRIGRRCRKCGSCRVKRIHKIVLAPDESISLYSVKGRLRWWIRRVFTMTFAVCLDCDWKELVKFSKGPMSIWHAWWTRNTDPKQYYMEGALTMVLYHDVKAIQTGLPASGKSSNLDDTPPLSLFPSFFDSGKKN